MNEIQLKTWMFYTCLRSQTLNLKWGAKRGQLFLKESCSFFFLFEKNIAALKTLGTKILLPLTTALNIFFNKRFLLSLFVKLWSWLIHFFLGVLASFNHRRKRAPQQQKPGKLVPRGEGKLFELVIATGYCK